MSALLRNLCDSLRREQQCVGLAWKARVRGGGAWNAIRRLRPADGSGRRASLLAAEANVGAAEQTLARRKTRVVAGGADDRLHRADDDGRLAC
jgi:hypothetical protein